MSQERGATEEGVQDLLKRWSAAEVAGDTEALGRMLAEDFVAVGPRGFTLTKAQWLDRLATGDLRYEALDVSDAAVRLYGEVAVVVGQQTQRASYQGHDANGAFRMTMVVVDQQGTPRIAGIHLSPMAAT